MQPPAARRRTVGYAWPRVIAAAGILLLLLGCHAMPRTHAGTVPPTVRIGQSSQTVTVDGRARPFHLYRPAALPSPAPVVVMLHGGFGAGTQAESAYHWDAEADAGHFLVAYPDGIDRAWSVGGGCCEVPGQSGVDDVAFVTAMLDAIARELAVDRNRLYATGISNGGLLAYRLACDSGVFAAIGPDSATMLGPCPTPAPVSVIHKPVLDRLLGIDPPSTALDATDTIWRFFAGHAKPVN
jgi:polyhydroxybutyrate depolymerase